MGIRFQILFQLEVVDDYHGGGRCPDLDFQIAPGEPALAAGKLLTRVSEGRLLVLYEADALKQPLRPIPGSTLWIALRSNNPALANVTRPPVAAGLLPFYRNAPLAGSLGTPLGLRPLAPQQRLTPVSAVRPLTLSWQRLWPDAAGPLAECPLTADDSEASVTTRQWPVGHYRLSEDAGGASGDWLQTAPWAGEPLWGVVAVTITGDFYAAPPVLRIALQARSETLKYYVVADNFLPDEVDQLQINDAGAAEQGRPPLLFTRLAAGDFSPEDDIPAASLHPDPACVVLFQSQTPVARRAGGYRKLQLKRNTEVLVQHLPQAGSDRAQARFVVHLAKS